MVVDPRSTDASPIVYICAQGGNSIRKLDLSTSKCHSNSDYLKLTCM
jgi:hypothetical protein